MLDTAATAALSHPGAPPRPDQFVYTKVGDGGGQVAQTWLSVDGSRNGLMEDPGAQRDDDHSRLRQRQAPDPAARVQRQALHGAGQAEGSPSPSTDLSSPSRVTPQPAFFPAMPTTASAMPAYLAKTQGVRLNDINDVAKVVGGIFQSDYLLPAQRAALYEFLATMPGLTLERNVKDITGRPGIGVSWSFMGSKAVLIFDPGTYTLLGMTTWGEQGQVAGAPCSRWRSRTRPARSRNTRTAPVRGPGPARKGPGPCLVRANRRWPQGRFASWTAKMRGHG